MKRLPKPYRDPDMIKLQRLIRERRDVTYKAMAVQARLSASTVRNIDTGKTRHPQHYTMAQLARAVGCEFRLVDLEAKAVAAAGRR